MANHKRKKARSHMGQGSSNYLKRKFKDTPFEWKWWQGTPSSHNIIFHHRPRRRKERELSRKILKGADSNNIAWPLAKKPHEYYW